MGSAMVDRVMNEISEPPRSNALPRLADAGFGAPPLPRAGASLGCCRAAHAPPTRLPRLWGRLPVPGGVSRAVPVAPCSVLVARPLPVAAARARPASPSAASPCLPARLWSVRSSWAAAGAAPPLALRSVVAAVRASFPRRPAARSPSAVGFRSARCPRLSASLPPPLARLRDPACERSVGRSRVCRPARSASRRRDPRPAHGCMVAPRPCRPVFRPRALAEAGPGAASPWSPALPAPARRARGGPASAPRRGR